MTPEQFDQWAELLTEPALLVAPEGEVLAANVQAEVLGYSFAQLRGRRLWQLSDQPEELLREYLRDCARSGQPMMGSLRLVHADGKIVSWRADGQAVDRDEGGRATALLIKLTPKEAAINRFSLLNQKLAELGEELRRRSALEYQLYRERQSLEVTLASIGDAVIVTDAAALLTFMNPVAEKLTGFSLDDARGRRLAEVFPIVNEQTRQPVEDPVAQVLRHGHIVGLANHTILLSRDGAEIPIDDSAAPIRDAGGAISGVVLIFRDVTERRRAEQQAADQQRWLKAVLNQLPVPVLFIEPGTAVVTFSNHAADELAGGEFPRGVPGEKYHTAYHCTDAAGRRIPDAEMPGVRVARGERLHDFEMTWHVGGEQQSLLLWADTLPSQYGHPATCVLAFQEISRLKKVEETLKYLAEASYSLADVADIESSLQKIAGVAVPTFADWCLVDLHVGNSRMRQVALVHRDPGKVQQVRQMQEQFPPRPDDRFGAAHVIRTGRAELAEDIPDSTLAELAHDERHLQMLRELGLRSYLCVPLIAQGRVRGTITFMTAESGRRYDTDSLKAAEDLARRAGVAIDNADLYERLRTADRRKDEFLATLAHELRNPLAPIRTGLEAMRLAAGNPEVLEEIRDTMERQARHLTRLIEDLMDVSRITRGRLKLRRQPAELSEILAAAVEAARPLIDQARHQLTVAAPERPVPLDADPQRLAQVFSNLLGNAAKFTPPGGSIRLSAAVEGPLLSVVVRDNGVGIPPEMREHIFEMFAQVQPPTGELASGLGIGLTIVKSLVEMHGGQVSVHSEGEGRGSEFCVQIPLPRAEPADDTQPATAERPAAGRRILVVDDNQAAAEMLGIVLRMQGHQVRQAHDGIEAIEAAAEFRPQVVLMDLGMPNMNGYDAARALRDFPWGGEIKIVAVTGWGQEEDKRRTREAGFDHHLVKPVEPSVLSDLLANFPPAPA